MKRFFLIIFSGLLIAALSMLSVAADMDEASEETSTEGEGSQAGAMKKSDSSEWGVHNSARVLIEATEEGSELSGRVDFVETGDGVQVVASLSNVVPSGKHGIHIHENGSCEDGGKAAGGRR